MKNKSYRRLISIFLLSLLTSLFAADGLADHHHEWISLFNGRDLEGWKISDHKESVKVDDGMLVVDGPKAHAFFVGGNGKAEFKDFHFQAQVKTMPNANSGIYFHTEFQATDWPKKGYECQVNNTHKDVRKTGGLYAIKDNLEAPVKDGEWFNYDIIVKGKQIVIKINGKTIVDYTEPNNPERNREFQNRVLSSGTFAIQAHDPKSVVYYRNIRVKRL